MKADERSARARFSALGAVIACLGAAPAQAQCTPSAATVTRNEAVTCSGAESGGFNLPDFSVTNLTITINSGATVTGSNPLGVFSLATGNTVVNNGTIIDTTGAFAGLSAAIGSGFTDASNPNPVDSDVVINNGSIVGVLDGINIGTGFPNGIETVTNNGTIQAGAAAIRFFGASAGVATNNGVINAAGANAGGIIGSVGFLQATNRGSITVTGTNGVGMGGFGDSNRLENSGTVAVTGTGAVGMGVTAVGSSVINSGLVTASGTNAGGVLLVGSNSSFTNTGRVVATGTNAVAVLLGGSGNTLILGTGSSIDGTVRSSGTNNGVQLTGDGVLPATVLGFNTLTMSGPGTWSLPTAVTFGNSFVNGGVLAVNGTLTSPVLVNPGGTLGGSGTVIGNVTNNGRVAPGNSLGTLTINGNYTQTRDGTLAVEVSPSGADRLVVGGAATLGGTLLFLPQAALFTEGPSFTVLTANSIQGAFDTVSGAPSYFLGLTPTVTAGQLSATVTRTRPYAAAGATDNQRAVGAALDRVRPGATGALQADLIVLDNTPTAATAQAALDGISGEAHASLLNVALDVQHGTQRALADRLSERRGFAAGASSQASVSFANAQLAHAGESPIQLAAAPATADQDRGGQAWIRLLGGTGGGQDSGRGGYDYIAGGAMAGADYRIAPDWIIGGAIGYVRSEADIDSRASNASIDSYNAALYGGWSSGSWFADASASVGLHRFDVRRQVAISAPASSILRIAEADYDALGASVYGAAGYRAAIGSVEITPEARLSYNRLHRDDFSEDGAGALGLVADGETVNAVRAAIGVTVSRSFAAGEQGIAFAPWARVFWQHEFADQDRLLAARFAGAAGSSFQVTGVEPGRDSALVGAGVVVGKSDAMRGFFAYDGEFSVTTAAHAVSAGVRVAF
jgi:fibronectin-binding autotransporter adhesin